MRARLAPLALTAALLVAASGCSGGDESSAASAQTPQEVLALAKTTLDETSGLQLTLSTDDLPDGVTGILEASGVGTSAPAFEGSITVSLSGQAFEVPVVAVDGLVYAQLPLTSGYQEVDPGEYGAPDPAGLVSPDQGFSSLLPETTGIEEGDSVRGGANNDEILTSYTGTVAGSVVENIIPGASGDFDATYTITEDGELREAVLTGQFYAGEDSMTYTVGFDDYGTQKDITAP
ncbi:LppX_LprAFG lipoprotein [Nocardioides psychrotolerans]|uniref:LppX_LprAFG lipoprotein n=1 Tax=Nocardioides psychrotolerans TaxID=1005945 RepID=UPI003137B1E1